MARIAKEAAGDKPVVEITALDLDAAIRGRLREAIEDILVEEFDGALGVARHGCREGRSGYRHGVRERMLTCQAGTTRVAVPRGGVFWEEGGTRKCGGPGQNRTGDTVIFSHVLYQLSYRATGAGI